jgi:hypothetical protein
MAEVQHGLIQKAKLGAEALRFRINWSAAGAELFVREEPTEAEPDQEWRRVGTFTNRRDVETFLVGLLCQVDR